MEGEKRLKPMSLRRPNLPGLLVVRRRDNHEPGLFGGRLASANHRAGPRGESARGLLDLHHHFIWQPHHQGGIALGCRHRPDGYGLGPVHLQGRCWVFLGDLFLHTHRFCLGLVCTRLTLVLMPGFHTRCFQEIRRPFRGYLYFGPKQLGPHCFGIRGSSFHVPRIQLPSWLAFPSLLLQAGLCRQLPLWGGCQNFLGARGVALFVRAGLASLGLG